MEYRTGTQCVQGSRADADRYGAVSFPIYQTAAYAHPGVGQSTGYDYSRVSNPTRDELQRTVAILEHGSQAFAFSTGMAAIAALMELFGPGDHIVAAEDLYGGALRLFREVSRKNGLEFTFLDTGDAGRLEAAIRPETKAVYLETPSNPMMQVTDIGAAAEIAHRHGCLLVTDNTFLTPYFQNPLDFGADVVIHSGTKYLGGHNDTLCGFLVMKDEALIQRLKEIYKTTGACLGAFDSWLVLRGIKTLALRMEQHQRNALEIAQWLKKRPEVKEVWYIGLPDHPARKIIEKQCRGYGGMLSFRVDSRERAQGILERLGLIRFAESLGGVESLMTYPMTQTHADVPEAQRKALGIDETLLRLSVGIEDVRDLIADLEQAFG